MNKYQSSNKTQQALIDAAGELASEDGFIAVTTRAIADRAGENIGSIHYHFGSKDKLFEVTLQTAFQRWLDHPVEKLLTGCDLKSRAGQAEAVRLAITRVANLLFDKDIPNWHPRVVYQVLQTDNNLRNIVLSSVMDPELEQISVLLEVIDSSLTKELLSQHFLLLFTPLFFHADYRSVILQQLGREEYSQTYLDTLLDNCIKRALLYYELPLQ